MCRGNSHGVCRQRLQKFRPLLRRSSVDSIMKNQRWWLLKHLRGLPASLIRRRRPVVECLGAGGPGSQVGRTVMAKFGATVAATTRVLEPVGEALDLEGLGSFEEGLQPLLLNIDLA